MTQRDGDVGAAELHAVVAQEVHALDAEARRLNLSLFENPELAFQEFRAADSLTRWLDGEGFAVERGVAGLDTAFVGSWGHGDPRIAFLLEYDALPEIGHACGHNLIATGGITAATAVRRVMDRNGIGGSLTVIGTPAEEDGGGKIIQLEAGVFDGIDAALMFHPGDKTLPWRHTLACAELRIRFHGLAAHAAKTPWLGRNALTAMIQFFVAVDGMRQHISPLARIHGVITNGGAQANIIPDLTEASLLVRHTRVGEVRELAGQVRACAAAAALATGTQVEITEPVPVYAERKANRTIARTLWRHLEDLGVEVTTPSNTEPGGSSDAGNVSQRLPLIHPYLKIVETGTSSHSIAFAEAAGSEHAHEVTMQMAQGLARTALDLFASPSLMQEVQHEFQTAPLDVIGAAEER